MDFWDLKKQTVERLAEMPLVEPQRYYPIPRTWAQIDTAARIVFERAARHFYPKAVWATGSWCVGLGVLGGNPKGIMMLRELARKRRRMNSDFDIIVEGMRQSEKKSHATFCLKHNVDILFFDTEHKLRIPMWDFSKLPVNRHGDAVRHTKNLDAAALLALHDEYKLSTFNYCCTDGVIEYFEWAIEKGLVGADISDVDSGGVSSGLPD